MSVRSVNIVLLAICLGLCGTLGFTMYLLLGREPSPQSMEPEVISNTITQTQIAVRKVGSTDFAERLANFRPLTWAAIESTNYQHYMAKLQAIGCPDETVKDILLTDIAKLYARRRAALVAGRTFEYWREDFGLGQDPEIREQLEALDAERASLVFELLGVDFNKEMASYWGGGFEQEQRSVGFLPEEKRGGVWAIHEQYLREEQAIQAGSDGLLLPEDQERLKEIEARKEAELAQLLTPEELLNYQLRNSKTAEQLRSELSEFKPTEEEFKTLFRLKKVFNDQFESSFDPLDPVAQATKARAEASARKALDGELLKVLGEDRYNEYVLQQDKDYRELLKVSGRLNLSKDLALRVYEMKRDAELQKQQVMSNPDLTEEQRRLALAAMSVEVVRSIEEEMGADNYRAYRSSGADWIGELVEPVQEVAVPLEPPLPVSPPPSSPVP